MRTSRKLALTAALVLAVAVLAALIRTAAPPGAAPVTRPATADPRGAGGAAPDPAAREPAPAVLALEPRRRVVAGAASLGEAAAEASGGIRTGRFRPEAYAMPRMRIFRGFWREASDSWDFERYREAETDVALLDGRQSYQVYVYLRTCLSAPRSERQAGSWLDRIERAVSEEAGEDDLRQVDRLLERVEQGLVRCEGLPEELEPLTMAWLTRAAVRGYPLAQIAYHRSYRWIASRKAYLLLGSDENLWTWRRLAPQLLQAAVVSGHAEAFLEMAVALDEGIVFERDPVEALAWLEASVRTAGGELQLGTELRRRLLDELSPDQQSDAQQRAVDLCADYCL